MCRGAGFDERYAASPSDPPLSADAFVPSSDRYGELVGSIVGCQGCGHGSLLERPAPDLIDDAYSHAEDAVMALVARRPLGRPRT